MGGSAVRQPPLSALSSAGPTRSPTPIARALELFSPDLIIACNHAARDEPGRVDHWVYDAPRSVPPLAAAPPRRRQAGAWAGSGTRATGPARSPAAPIENWGGSSGLLCVAVALSWGLGGSSWPACRCSRPLGTMTTIKHWLEARQYWPAWERIAPA
jgi:hypothetical protein